MGDSITKKIEEQLASEVSAILAVDPAKILIDVPLHKLGMDSLSFVELMVVIEKTYSLKLMEARVSQKDLQTIQTIAACISRLRTLSR